MDVKFHLSSSLAAFANNPNSGISNFGILIIKGFGIYTLSILLCVYLNDYFSCSGRQTRCWTIIVFLCPNVARAFGWRCLSDSNQARRLICSYLTGHYNTAFVPTLFPTTANTAGHTRKVATNAVHFLGYCTGNIAGPFCHLTSQAPQYALGIWNFIVSLLDRESVVAALRTTSSRRLQLLG